MADPTPDIPTQPQTAPASEHTATTAPARGPGLHSEEARQLGRYVLLERLGAGGMGEVYAAFDKTLDRKVALKLLYPTADGTQRDEMLAEARALAQLSHTAVVGVHDVGVVQNRAYIAMEYASGEPLNVWQRQRAWRHVLSAYLEVGEGLHAAHRAGLVHRDFKPSNVVRRDDDRVQLLDFGIAQKAAVARPDSVPTARIAGTPGYMSPEQMMGLPVDARSDQFSFCVALYEALLGLLPFGETTDEATVLRIRDRQFLPVVESPKIPRRILAALRKGLSFEAKDRYPSMAELLRALRRAQPPDRRSWVVLFVVSVLAGLAVAVAWVRPRTACNSGQAAVRGEWAKLREQVPKTLHGSPDAVQEIVRGADAWMHALDQTSARVCQDFVTAKLTADQLSIERQCLAERQGELLAAMESLRGEKSVGRARDALMQYVPPERCLEATSQTELARHDAEREAWTAWVKAERALAGGSWLEGLALSQSAVEQSRGKSPALLSAALRSQGLAYDRLGEPKLAAARLHEAAQVAIAAGDGTKAATAWIPLARVMGLAFTSSSAPRAPWVMVSPGGDPYVWLDYAAPEVKARRNWVELSASYELVRALLELRRGDEEKAKQAVRAAEDLLPGKNPMAAAVRCASAVTEHRADAVDQAFDVLKAAREEDETPASAWLAMGDWLVLLPKEQSAPAAVKLLEQVRARLPHGEGAAARVHFALVAWQAGAEEEGRAELAHVLTDEDTPAKVKAIAALRLRQIGDRDAEVDAAQLEGMPSLEEAWDNLR
ncbi:MAG: serine/threonine-protein kinase [Myxococcaceae bacterium]